MVLREKVEKNPILHQHEKISESRSNLLMEAEQTASKKSSSSDVNNLVLDNSAQSKNPDLDQPLRRNPIDVMWPLEATSMS
jgi:hypothetical protein